MHAVSYRNLNCVSDDECARYHFSLLLGSTSLVQPYLPTSLLYVLVLRKNVIYDTSLSLVHFLSISWCELDADVF